MRNNFPYPIFLNRSFVKVDFHTSTTREARRITTFLTLTSIHAKIYTHTHSYTHIPHLLFLCIPPLPRGFAVKQQGNLPWRHGVPWYFSTDNMRREVQCCSVFILTARIYCFTFHTVKVHYAQILSLVNPFSFFFFCCCSFSKVWTGSWPTSELFHSWCHYSNPYLYSTYSKRVTKLFAGYNNIKESQ